MESSMNGLRSLKDDPRGQSPTTGVAVVGVIIAAVVAILFLPVAVDAVNNSTGLQSVGNESVNSDYDTHVDLQGYDIDENSETVYGYNDTSGSWEVAPGSDYEMDYDAGSINISSSSTLIQDGEEVRVSYDYQAAGTTTTLIAGFIPLMIGVLVFVTLAKGVMDRL
jgi:hypothetical protein